MKKIYFSLLAIATVALASCEKTTKDEPNPTPGGSDNPNAVEVTISTANIETKAAQLEFKSNDAMNIFPKVNYQTTSANIVDGVKATYDGSKWTMTPAVKIDETQKNAFIYAVSPYDASYTELTKIPVDLNKQVDLMYSGSYVPASLTSPAVKLNMKHALSLMTFNIVPVNYKSAGSVKEFKLGDVCVSGTLDASTGKLTKGTQKGTVTAAVNKTVNQGGWRSDLPGIWTMPFNTKIDSEKAKFSATIDGKTYQLEVPEVEMKQGYQYIFRLVLTDNGLEFDPSKTETISLNVTDDAEQSFQGYGKVSVKTSGSTMLTPSFSGDMVFGTVNAPGKTMPYSPVKELDGLSSGQTVVIESWNSTGFTFETLEGVGTIDLSQYE